MKNSWRSSMSVRLCLIVAACSGHAHAFGEISSKDIIQRILSAEVQSTSDSAAFVSALELTRDMNCTERSSLEMQCTPIAKSDISQISVKRIESAFASAGQPILIAMTGSIPAQSRDAMLSGSNWTMWSPSYEETKPKCIDGRQWLPTYDLAPSSKAGWLFRVRSEGCDQAVKQIVIHARLFSAGVAPF